MNTMKTTYIVLELIIAVLSIAGNVLVCWAVAINSTLKNATNYFLVSLAVADIAVGLLAIPFAITISIAITTTSLTFITITIIVTIPIACVVTITFIINITTICHHRHHFSGHGGVGLMVRLDDCEDLCQPT